MITPALKEKLLSYNGQVPRYTSYPSAPHFQPMGQDAYAGWLESLPQQAQGCSVYIHIPFCTAMCWYCGCHTTATRKYAPVEDYVSLLLREMRHVAARLPHHMRIGHVHFGGGSPTMLQPADFSRIMQGLRALFDVLPDAEIAIEADPRGITHDRCTVYAREGVNRASLGIQDFSLAVQAAINRIQPYDEVQRAVGLLRDFGISRLNFDLMYGLPLQSLADVADTAEKSLALSPQRIALFGYAHVPWMKKHMRLIKDEDLPDSAARLDQFSHAEDILGRAGMQAVGLDHFCAQGDDMLAARDGRKLARNFQGYTTDSCPVLLGFGLSSIGRLPQGYIQNHANLTEYSKSVLAGELCSARGYALTDDDRLRGQIISDLMCYLTVDVAAVAASHGRDAAMFDAVLQGLKDMAADGLVEVRGSELRIAPQARQMVRVVAARFDAHFSGGPRRHVQAA